LAAGGPEHRLKVLVSGNGREYLNVTELSGDQIGFQRRRRASDRAEDRASRAADHGDPAAMRIAGGQLEALLRERAAYRRDGLPGAKRRFDLGGDR
jgi:hypothetical protein